MHSNSSLTTVLPQNLPTHTLQDLEPPVHANLPKKKFQYTQSQNTPTLPQETALTYKTQLTHNQSPSELMLKPGNSTAEESSLTAEPH